MNIPPRARSEKGVGRSARTALCFAVAFCATLTACRFELAVDAGTLAPSVGEVRTLLDQDRVRLALDRADLLSQRGRGPETDLVSGWAHWRNGRVRAAEARFRRAAGAGSGEANIGMATVAASAGDWEGAARFATIGLDSDTQSGRGHALLASAAWIAGDRAASIRELRAWSAAESGTARGRAAEAMAAAMETLRDPVHLWDGAATSLPLVETADGALAVEAAVGGRRVLLAIDLTYRQSLISEPAAVAAGLSVVGAATPGSRGASARWPSVLSSRQVGCPAIEFGDLSVRNVVLAVSGAPRGTDGVLGIDLLSQARWSFDPVRRTLLLGPPSGGATSAGDAVGEPSRTIAWLSARLAYEGVSAQLLLYPRLEGEVTPAGLDVTGISRLDSDLLPVRAGSGAAPAGLALGGWKGETTWRPTSLAGWAVDGGIAPVAVLGRDVVAGWSLHWYPASAQLRIDGPAGSD